MGKLSSVEGNVHSVFSKLGPLRECLAAASEDWETWSLSQLAEKVENYVDRNNLTEKWSNENKFDKNSQSHRYGQERYGEANRNKKYEKEKSKMFYNGDNKTTENKTKCAFCGYFNHVSKNCLKILDLSKRREIAQSKKLCFVCLKEGHFSNKCKAKKCEKCNGSHHVAICDKSEKSSIPEGDLSEKSMGMIQKRLKFVSIHPTALVEVNGIPARVLSHSGSSG